MNLFKWMLILIGVLASVSQSHGETYPRTWMTVTNEISRNENISTLGTADWKKETECVAVNDLFAEEEVLTGNSNDGTGLNVSSSHGRILSRLLERQNEGFLGLKSQLRTVSHNMPEVYTDSDSGIREILEIFEKARLEGARVQNNSWGIMGLGKYSLLSTKIDEYIYQNPDVALVFARTNERGMQWLDNSKNIIYVGENGNVFQNISISQGLQRPIVFAPSYSTVLASDGNYIGLTGSSISAAMISGELARMRAYYKERCAHVPSSSLLRATLMSGCDEWGRYDSRRLSSGLARRLLFDDDNVGLQQHDEAEYELNVNDGESVVLTLAWVDAPSDTGSLVNDLDLCLVLPNGEQVYGNLLEDGYDRNRNVERILLTNAPEGKYVIRVKAYNITCGRRQPYAVVFRASDSISESEMQLAASPLNMHLLERAEPISCGEGRYPIVPLFKSKIWIFGFSPTHTTLTASGLMLSMQNPPVGIPSPLSYNDVFTELITKQTLIAESADDGDQNSLTLFTILGILPGGASPSLGYHFMNPIGVGLPPGVYDEAVNYPDANWWIKAINA